MHTWHNPAAKPPVGAPIAAFDYDETLGRGVLHWKFAPHLARLGVIRDPHEEPEIREARAQRYRREQAYKQYEEALIRVTRTRYAEVGMSRDRLKAYAKDFVTSASLLEEQYAFPRALFYALREQGYALVLISHAPIELTHAMAEVMGFHHAIGNIIQTDETGIFTGNEGRVPIKEQDLKTLVEEFGYSLTDSVAIGDSMGDLGMLKMVEIPIAFNPKPSLRQALDTDPICASIRRIVERAEVVTCTQAEWVTETASLRLEERRIESVLPSPIGTDIRSALEKIGYYLF